MFAPEASAWLASYSQSEDESNHLFHIPKLFLVNASRGDYALKARQAGSNDVVAQLANFSQVYANREGFSIMGSSEVGGTFTRCVCTIFQDKEFVQQHKWTDIVFKIREHTKRQSTLIGKLFDFTQIVENEETLERPLVISSKYLDLQTLNVTIDKQGLICGYTESLG